MGQGEVVWAREESLSGVEQALFADLPPEPSHSAVKDLAQMWQHLAHHLRMQMIHFKMRMKIASAEESVRGLALIYTGGECGGVRSQAVRLT